jgi:ribulose-5-phosphate 4-epimerase/fuculose-1-phosphate aldolase
MGRAMTDQLEDAVRRVVETARYLHDRGLTHGSTGNVSVRVGELVVVTPTGLSLRTITAADLAVIDVDGRRHSGGTPSKEAVLHAAVYRARPGAGAVIHTHSVWSTAVSCLRDIDEDDALPSLTAYYRMRVGVLPIVPFYPPGAPELAAHAGRVAARAHCMLLRNHGPIAAGDDLDHALDVLEELEHTAHLRLLLDGRPIVPVPAEAARRLSDPHIDPPQEA